MAAGGEPAEHFRAWLLRRACIGISPRWKFLIFSFRKCREIHSESALPLHLHPQSRGPNSRLPHPPPGRREGLTSGLASSALMSLPVRGPSRSPCLHLVAPLRLCLLSSRPFNYAPAWTGGAVPEEMVQGESGWVGRKRWSPRARWEVTGWVRSDGDLAWSRCGSRNGEKHEGFKNVFCGGPGYVRLLLLVFTVTISGCFMEWTIYCSTVVFSGSFWQSGTGSSCFVVCIPGKAAPCPCVPTPTKSCRICNTWILFTDSW